MIKITPQELGAIESDLKRLIKVREAVGDREGNKSTETMLRVLNNRFKDAYPKSSREYDATTAS